MRKGLRFSLLPAVFAFSAFFIVAPQSGADATVHIKTSGTRWRFAPATSTLRAGQRVAFVNDSDATHTATGASWDSGDIQPGQTKIVIVAGTGEYACRYHGQSGMTGKIAAR